MNRLAHLKPKRAPLWLAIWDIQLDSPSVDCREMVVY